MSSTERDQLVELQTQLAFQEDLLSALDRRVTEQDAELRMLRQQFKQLAQLSREMHSAMADRGISEPGLAAQIEKPPHY